MKFVMFFLLLDELGRGTEGACGGVEGVCVVGCFGCLWCLL